MAYRAGAVLAAVGVMLATVYGVSTADGAGDPRAWTIILGPATAVSFLWESLRGRQDHGRRLEV